MALKRISLSIHVSPEDCKNRLRAALESKHIFSPLRGEINGERFIVRSMGSGSIFELNGRFFDENGSVRIDGNLDLRRSFKILAFFFLLAASGLIFLFLWQWHVESVQRTSLSKSELEFGVGILCVILVAIFWFSIQAYTSIKIITYYLDKTLRSAVFNG